ncbi:homoserine dehydrogenase [Kitasatospora sp. NPDC001309]|uniref:homoserine dehydrogenase n=1 Tax=Kitasatospora sp. NPDC001309 TaxID=3364013 RepID=UPI0036CBE46F
MSSPVAGPVPPAAPGDDPAVVRSDDDPAVVLSGFGPVGRAFAERLLTHADGLARDHGVRPRLAAVRVGSAEVELRDGGPVPPRAEWAPPGPLARTLDRTGARVLVQALPSSPQLRQQAADEAVLALGRGVHVVTATKSHLLGHWRELGAAARAGGSLIRISGATGAALPTADLARTGVRGLGCRTVRACPNGTATFVLDRLAAGDSLDRAVGEAQRLGIAEADPSADLSGADAATKVRLLAALLWGWDPSAVRVDAVAVDAGTGAAALAAAAEGRQLRAVASASADRPLVVEVRLEPTAPGDPLYALTGPEKAVVYGCPEAGDITVSGGRSSPLGAALAMLRDTLDVTAPRGHGFG